MVWLVPVLERFPRSHKFLLADRIQNVALDVLEALIEATYTKRRTGLLARANLGIKKLRFLVRLAGDLSHLDRRRYEYAARCRDETGRKVSAWSNAHRARESRNLFDDIASFPALHAAVLRAVRGKRAKPGAMDLFGTIDARLAREWH